jgi:hypothetical protein
LNVDVGGSTIYAAPELLQRYSLSRILQYLLVYVSIIIRRPISKVLSSSVSSSRSAPGRSTSPPSPVTSSPPSSPLHIASSQNVFGSTTTTTILSTSLSSGSNANSLSSTSAPNPISPTRERRRSSSQSTPFGERIGDSRSRSNSSDVRAIVVGDSNQLSMHDAFAADLWALGVLLLEVTSGKKKKLIFLNCVLYSVLILKVTYLRCVPIDLCWD